MLQSRRKDQREKMLLAWLTSSTMGTWLKKGGEEGGGGGIVVIFSVCKMEKI